jgi:hypothetical protein
MATSANEKVQEFINETKMLDNTKYQILETLRKIVFEHFPKVEERMMYGGIIFSLDEDCGGVFVYKNHLSFEFSLGFKFKDPENYLEGNGKFRRHLKIRSIEDIVMKKAGAFIKQMDNGY